MALGPERRASLLGVLSTKELEHVEEEAVAPLSSVSECLVDRLRAELRR